MKVRCASLRQGSLSGCVCVKLVETRAKLNAEPRAGVRYGVQEVPGTNAVRIMARILFYI